MLYRQPEKRSEYQTLVLNDRPFGNPLAVSFFRRRARLRSRAYFYHCSIEKRSGKTGRDVSFNEIHVLYSFWLVVGRYWLYSFELQMKVGHFEHILHANFSRKVYLNFYNIWTLLAILDFCGNIYDIYLFYIVP